jgi:hypothetical protein
MSTQLESNASNVSMTRFWGGQRGACVQVTQPRSDTNLTVDFTDRFWTSLQLTREQAGALGADLLAFANGTEVEDI